MQTKLTFFFEQSGEETGSKGEEVPNPEIEESQTEGKKPTEQEEEKGGGRTGEATGDDKPAIEEETGECEAMNQSETERLPELSESQIAIEQTSYMLD